VVTTAAAVRATARFDDDADDELAKNCLLKKMNKDPQLTRSNQHLCHTRTCTSSAGAASSAGGGIARSCVALTRHATCRAARARRDASLQREAHARQHLACNARRARRVNAVRRATRALVHRHRVKK
jgi:hypothetical protein